MFSSSGNSFLGATTVFSTAAADLRGDDRFSGGCTVLLGFWGGSVVVVVRCVVRWWCPYGGVVVVGFGGDSGNAGVVVGEVLWWCPCGGVVVVGFVVTGCGGGFSLFFWSFAIMGDRRSKKDLIQQISTSIYVTNFPEHFSFRDLWKACEVYGRVTDVYVPNKRSKIGKQFGFVRFIKIQDVDRLVNNLCTIWFGRLKLHAHAAKFQRQMLNNINKDARSYGEKKHVVKDYVSNSRNVVNDRTYVYAVKEGKDNIGFEEQKKPDIVLDESCILHKDFSLSMFGKVKEFSSLSNLKMILATEGFNNVNVNYMGGFWVVLEFQSLSSKEKFTAHVGVGYWFDTLQQASNSFNLDGRVAWVDIEGVPLKVWTKNTFNRIISKWEWTNGGTNDKDGSNGGMNGKQSEDPFNIYDLLKKQQDKDKEAVLSEDVLKYLLGFTPKEHTDVSSNLVGSESGEETKMENVDVNDIKLCRGNCLFEFICGPSVGNSGGLWVFSDKRLMIITVYAPQEVSEKRMLWEYLNHVIHTWNGEVVIMRDSNKVRSREERYGTTFNKRGADVFNSFISLGGLADVPLEGCSFTWVHKSTSKMSKLDRFLISVGLIEARPNISTISLDRYLSDHRPILLREFYVDQFPFAFITTAKIRIWIKARKEKSSLQKTKLKGILTDLDLVIDKGEANSDILNKRLHILKDIQSQMAIRGIFVDGAWLESPNLVKEEFLNHFKDQFDHLVSSRLILDMDFPNTLSLDQRDELESSISKEEFKRVVWDCGLDNFIKKRIGNGEKSSFWEEVWKGGDTLKLMYPRLYALDLSKNISVANKLAQVDMVGSFRRPPRGGVELQQYTCFRSILEDVILSNSQDMWLWSLTGSGEFSVASVRRFIDDYMLPDVSFKTKWLKVVPIQINSHAWKVKLDGLPTRFNLSRRGIYINSINCPCCAMAVETTSHLFFTCFMVRELYRKIAIWWDIKLMEVDSFEGWTVWMSNIRLHGFRKERRCLMKSWSGLSFGVDIDVNVTLVG
uniref:Nucleotide-binding alpha-beta plait domain-containing protein n=1 Tax=Tanacetum cinerariifolium TaxID=118510 RepID=A0A6L2JGV5_TANCI|nr:nucleotide-binding alpha-beta plait domain-containing protein [Tanacetum cinerariifolium]